LTSIGLLMEGVSREHVIKELGFQNEERLFETTLSSAASRLCLD
jgi:hypothetical protein